MKAHIQIALFKQHQGDPLSAAISALTRSQYCHAAILTDPATNTIYEQYAPHCRFRKLDNSELTGVDLFSISGWTDRQDVSARLLIAQRAAAKIPYWPEGLLKFTPEGRALLGEGTVDDFENHAFCSMEDFEIVRLQDCELLRANCWEVHPGLLSMSPILIPEPEMTPVY